MASCMERCVVIFTFLLHISQSQSGTSRREIVKSRLENYDATVPPNFEQDTPTHVHVQLYIHSVDSFSESTMDFSMSIFLRQKWLDPRLAYSEVDIEEPLELDSRTLSSIWVPDLYFVNEKDASYHDITVPNRMLHLYKNGTIFYSVRLSLVLSCQMNLAKYPMDTQVCPISMESYGYTMDNLVLHWFEQNPVEKSKDLILPHFEWESTDIFDCSRGYGTTVGNFTCIRAIIELHRKMGYYAIQIYVPSALIVVLSWVSFWLNVDAIPARISLGVLTVLTLTTQSSGLRASLPKVSYIKALDIWMAMCMVFVFAALLEFAIVNVLTRGGKLNLKSTLKSLRGKANTIENDSEKNGKGEHSSRFGSDKKRKQRAMQVDKVSRILFPTVFLTLNLVYWTFYSLWHVERPHH